MKLPSKSTTYKNSVIALFPDILRTLREQSMSAAELHGAFEEVPLGDLINALDCLYALRMIDVDVERRHILYVGADSVRQICERVSDH